MSELKVAVVGAGMMGADHVKRITQRIKGAQVSWIIEPDLARAQAAAIDTPGAKVAATLDEAINKGDIDAVLIASPGQFHEAGMMTTLKAGLPTLCEKPLTPDPESALRVVEAEQALGKRFIQVGFMRRYDKEYMELHDLIAAKSMGELLGLRCQHRNPSVQDSYTNSMLITDSVVHEIDIVRYLTGSVIKAIEVKHFRRNSTAPERLNEPILALLETESGILADVEMNVSVKFGYQVKTEALFENGIMEIGRTSGSTKWQNGKFGGEEHLSYTTRFNDAYDFEIQQWVNSTKLGQVHGPSVWDGYLVAAACKAGVEAMETGKHVDVKYEKALPLYK